MGSRAVIVLCRSPEAAKARFGVEDSGGIIFTRTGRHFFDGPEKDSETALLARLRAALDASGFWEAFSTDWVCLDTELMPWSAKAHSLVVEQYAPAGLAGRRGLARAIAALEQAAALHPAGTLRETPGAAASGAPGGMDPSAVLGEFRVRAECLELYTEAYRRYCRDIHSVDDYRIAPFHILATENRVWHDETHLRHLQVIRDYITGADPVFVATSHIAVDVNDPVSVEAGTAWWLALAASGGEGMVVKPLDFITRRENRLVQPAVKCRGREYLRIIYGPEYTGQSRLERLRKRSLRKKQDLALAEFSLGMEALERFVRREPLSRVHECVFGILALENETVDPRL
jgi:protein phosphatase